MFLLVELYGGVPVVGSGLGTLGVVVPFSDGFYGVSAGHVLADVFTGSSYDVYLPGDGRVGYTVYYTGLRREKRFLGVFYRFFAWLCNVFGSGDPISLGNTVDYGVFRIDGRVGVRPFVVGDGRRFYDLRERRIVGMVFAGAVGLSGKVFFYVPYRRFADMYGGVLSGFEEYVPVSGDVVRFCGVSGCHEGVVLDTDVWVRIRFYGGVSALFSGVGAVSGEFEIGDSGAIVFT